MGKFKDMLKDNSFIRWSFFIVFNATLLYILYFIIKNIGSIGTGLLSILSVLIAAFEPLIIGLILAYLLNPLSELIDRKIVSRIGTREISDPIKLEKSHSRRHFLSVILTYILVIAIVIAIICGFAIMIMGKVVFTDTSDLIQSLIKGITEYESTFRGWITHHVPEGVLSDKLADVTTMLMNWLTENISATSVITFFTNIGGSIVDLVIGMIVSIYLMKDKKFFLGLWDKFLGLTLSERRHSAVNEVLGIINKVFSKFIRGALLDALFVAILSSIGLSVMGLEGAVFIGVFAGIANVIPYFGPVLGMIPAFIMGLCTGGFWHGAIAVIILLIVQQIDSNLIYPKVVGSTTGLHPLMVLLAVSVFGYFGGILGMLLAVPIAGVIQEFVVRWVKRRESCKITNEAPQEGTTSDTTQEE
jgi:predicted PurR-regulated permease PerM